MPGRPLPSSRDMRRCILQPHPDADPWARAKPARIGRVEEHTLQRVNSRLIRPLYKPTRRPAPAKSVYFEISAGALTV